MRSRTSLTSGQFLRLPAFCHLERRLVGQQQLDAGGVVDRGAEPVARTPRTRRAVSSRRVVAVGSTSDAQAHTAASSVEPGVEVEPGSGGGASMRSSRSQLSSRNSATRRRWSSRAPAASRISERLLERGVVEQLVDEVVRHRSSNASSDEISSCTSMRGGKPGLDRELGEDALREGVQRADRGGVELVERLGTAGPRSRRRSRRCASAPRARGARGRAARPRPSR